MTPKEIIDYLHELGCDFEMISSKQIIRITHIPSKHSLSGVLDKFATETNYQYRVNMVTLLTRKEPFERPFMTKKQTVLFLLKADCDFELLTTENQIKIKQIPSEMALKKINKLYLKREYKGETDIYITIFLK